MIHNQKRHLPLRPLEGERAAAAAQGCTVVRIVNDCIGKQAAVHGQPIQRKASYWAG